MTLQDDTQQGPEGPLDTDRRIHSKNYLDGEIQSPSDCVIETIADATGTDPMDMGVLYETIDADALDKLFNTNGGQSDPAVNGYVSFRFEGCDVAVHGDGRVFVVPEGATDS